MRGSCSSWTTAPAAPAMPRDGWAGASWSIRATARSSSGRGAATCMRLRRSTTCIAPPTARAFLAASGTLLARPRSALGRMRTLAPAIIRRLLPGGGHGWSARAHTARLFDGFTVLLNIEQLPHPDNRVTLGRRRDAFGVPLPTLEWRWRPDDQRRLDRLRALVAADL